MTLLQYLNAFRQFGTEVLLIALAVAVASATLQKKLPKKTPALVRSVLPFILGVLFYGIYRFFTTVNVIPLIEEMATVFSNGFACGSAATVYSVLYEKKFKQKRRTSLSPVYPLLSGYVPESKRAEAAKELYEGSLTIDGEQRLAFLDETLKKYVYESVTPESRLALCILIDQFLRSLQKSR